MSATLRIRMPRHEVSDTVKNLVVDKDEFDRALKRLIATPPIRSAAIEGKPKPYDKRPTRAKSEPSR
jgi:hypothetical protein